MVTKKLYLLNTKDNERSFFLIIILIFSKFSYIFLSVNRKACMKRFRQPFSFLLAHCFGRN